MECSDEKILDQINDIEKDIREKHKIISDSLTPHELHDVYKDNQSPGFMTGIEYLIKKFGRMRLIRGDGNCFYR